MKPASHPELGRRKLAAENSRFFIYLDELTGDEQTYVADYLVVVPKLRWANITGVAVLPVYQGKIGLIRVYRHPIQDSVWEVPRGFLEEGEIPAAAALRELEEETGLICPEGALEPLGMVAPEPGVLNACIQLFAATRCTKARLYTPNELGHQDLCWFAPAQLKRMILRSDVQSGITVVACCRYLLDEAGASSHGRKH